MSARDTRDSRAAHPAAPDRTPPRRTGAAPQPLLALQRSAGNAAVVQFLRQAGHAEAQEPVVVQRAGGKDKDNGEGSSGGDRKGKAVKKDNGKGEEEESASAQGEHVFNALDDLAKEFAGAMMKALGERAGFIQGNRKSLSETQRTRSAGIGTVKDAINHLRTSATEAGTSRDHARFRSASHGGPKGKDGDQNSQDYGQYKRDVMAALGTCGTREWRDAAELRALQDRLMDTIYDGAAADVLRNEDLVGGTKGSSVGKKRTNTADQQAFDRWVTDTSTLMTNLFREMVTTANQLHAVLRQTRRGALGYSDNDPDLSGTDAEPDSDPEE
ncbi:hypothetical protein [Streptomyces showdoensis]|uniref:Uncharacterized protein n=1 Tax=Streptomyces showdoensis TaxID=68268 RepID=A0A2P2GTB9_STREW|nr:hypothetical protein [Streptomyces showdoensis]KKZ74748.1 hypothetical protein VO63_06635 [Streptomyces showdoensis]